MASTEEVISTLLADDYIHSSIQFLIDENMRTVTVPPEGVVLGVTGDKDVNRINFKMVRYYDGLDLSTFQIRINYVNANGDANYYQVTDTTIEDDSILFTWLVSSDAAAYKGTVSFAARLYTVEDTIVKESFNSTIATAEVLEGIIVDEYMPPDAQQDLIALLMSQIEFPEGVGRVDATAGATAHGEIFNDYTHNAATGGFSHAEGNSTTASGANSHAEGSDTTASSNCAHAEGFSTTASKYYSHAEGSNTTASGTSSHAEGSGTTASGYYSHAEGSTTNATADTSHAEGSGTTASGTSSHAEGSGTTATAVSSHAEGSNTTASGTNSHAEGYYTYAAISEQHVQGRYNVKDTDGVYAMIIGNGTGDDTRSNRFTVDWNGNIQCGKTDTSGNFTAYGTINGVDITDLLNRIAILESQLTPVVENLFDTSMIYHMLTEGYITHNDTNYYYATVDSANNVISFIYEAKGMKILNDGALFESDTQYIIEADMKTSTASEGTDVGTGYNGGVEIKYSDNVKANVLVSNTSEYKHVSYTTEAGKTVKNLYVKCGMVSGLNVDTILYIKNLVIKKA